MKREVMPKELQDKSSTSPNPTMDAAVFINLRARSEVYKMKNEIFRRSTKLPFQRIKNQ
jgi:hypothetical protein